MNDTTFETFIHRAAGAVSRRVSLRVLGGAAMASALAAPATASAGIAGKKARKKCKQQQGGCEAEAREFCAGNTDCLNALLPCCALLATCKGREATECFLSG